MVIVETSIPNWVVPTQFGGWGGGGWVIFWQMQLCNSAVFFSCSLPSRHCSLCGGGATAACAWAEEDFFLFFQTKSGWIKIWLIYVGTNCRQELYIYQIEKCVVSNNKIHQVFNKVFENTRTMSTCIANTESPLVHIYDRAVFL